MFIMIGYITRAGGRNLLIDFHTVQKIDGNQLRLRAREHIHIPPVFKWLLVIRQVSVNSEQQTHIMT